ncbi:MAG: ligase-associated DNA damage response exonuclease [Candidatus Kapabacteria bacterium]|nr:ligase-associated DNA damage response exonuclease [Candidatus Kapabacteria bacterium]
MLVPTSHGLYCPQGDFFIDPRRSVARAVITHGHSDHAYRGMDAYLCTQETVPILRHRLGAHGHYHGVRYGETVVMNGVRVSFHPAGHVIGSAQVRLEYAGEVWVVSGDYKRQADPFAVSFEPVRCSTFITETTFGLPIYRWPSPSVVAAEINNWWRENAAAGRTSIIQAYSLGKAQRIMGMVDASIGPMMATSAVHAMNTVLADAGHALPPWKNLAAVDRNEPLTGSLVITTGIDAALLRRCKDAATASASGWMAIRGFRRRGNHDRGFVVSDHTDWPDLMRTIRETGAERILATHGSTSAVVRTLQEQGLQAAELEDVGMERTE